MTQNKHSETVKKWEHGNRECKITLNKKLGVYCGYVKTEQLEGDYYEYIEKIDIHGGPTYGIDEEGWIGFDCGHSGDVCLDNKGNEMNKEIVFKEERVWDVEKVKKETEKLAEQVVKLEKERNGIKERGLKILKEVVKKCDPKR